MEIRYRLGPAPRGGHRAGALRRLVCAMSVVVLSGLLPACQAPVGGPKTMGLAAGGPEEPGKLAIIVNLAADDGARAAGTSDDNSVAAVTARVTERLKAAMPAEEFAAVRTFNLFPAIALSADGALIARILAMPEVVSIERDQELRLEEPRSGLRFQ